MVLNPPPAHVSQDARQLRNGPNLDQPKSSQFFELDSYAGGRRINDSSGPKTDQIIRPRGDLQKLSSGFYGDYWDAPLEVISVSAFEAQLFWQEGLGSNLGSVSHNEGTQLYQGMISILEKEMGSPADTVIEENNQSRYVNVFA